MMDSFLKSVAFNGSANDKESAQEDEEEVEQGADEVAVALYESPEVGEVNPWVVPVLGSQDDDSMISTSSSSVEENTFLKEGTGIRVTGYSRGFSAEHYLPRGVFGVKIKGYEGLMAFAAKHLQTYYVTRVLSPFEFYLERQLEHKEEQMAVREKMQEHYEEAEMGTYMYLIEVTKNRCYAYYDANSKYWWRVRVLDIELKENDDSHAHIYYCDTGKQEYILCRDLRMLEEDFQGSFENAILKCYLYDVLPVSGDLHWSLEAIVFFKEFVTEMRLGAVVVKMTKKPAFDHCSDVTVDCGVILVNKVDPEEVPETINWLMVERGFARSIGFGSTSPYCLDIPGFIPSFDVPKPISDAKHKTEELSVIVARAIENTGPALSVHTHHEKPTTPVTDIEDYDYLHEDVRKRLPCIKMSYFEDGPGKFFIHYRYKTDELKAMEAELNKISKDLPQPSFESLTIGAFVCCDIFDLQDGPSGDVFARSVILKLDPSLNEATVLLLDYGSIVNVVPTIIYELPEKYRGIPSFVHRVHLSDISPNYGFLTWDISHNELFFKYLLSFEEDDPLYYIYRPDDSDVIQFTDLEQDVIFNKVDNKWIADSPKDSGENEKVNSLREHPMLASYFCSKAVRIYFEDFDEDEDLFKFSNLTEFFVEKEGALNVNVGAKVDHDKIHELISKGFGVL